MEAQLSKTSGKQKRINEMNEVLRVGKAYKEDVDRVQAIVEEQKTRVEKQQTEVELKKTEVNGLKYIVETVVARDSSKRCSTPLTIDSALRTAAYSSSMGDG